MSNWIVSIGFTGIFNCYLNIDEDEAIRRYKKSENITDEEMEGITVNVIHFDEEFGAYEVWDNEN